MIRLNSRGFRRKSRALLTKDKIRGLSYLLHDYKVGDKVTILIDPSEHNGMPHKRFHGRVGIVEEVGRRTLKVRVKVGDKYKKVIGRLNHFKPFNE
ncbi:MAG: 50S ribosomal protein L21 [Candidatus Nitrosothermus koennekii]|nr:MAG: 50S ribosomal protein L21 [Candidatus Nitrosothermus koennekii]